MAEELKDILNEYSRELYASKEEALDKASDFMLEALERNSPVDTGKFQKSWLRTDKYKGVRYIGNSAVGGKNKYNYNIPLSNLIEFSSKGKPFIRRTFDANREKIVEIIKGELENGNSK
jgi:HK97 gp10 family phage protein